MDQRKTKMWLRLALVFMVVILLCDLTDAKKKKNRNRPRIPSTSSVLTSRTRTRSGSSGNGCPRNRPNVPTSNVWSCPTPNFSCPAGFQDPPLLIISLDGYRADYIERKLNPTLQKIINCGVHAKYMRSVFPTTTYPNHYSMVTGLHAESHGIIDNDMYDRIIRQKLEIETNGNNSIWWKSEPLWVTAEKSNKRTGTFYWLGSEGPINGIMPTYNRIYRPSSHPWSCRVDTILDWLDLPTNARPSFMTLYFNQPDNVGHKFGPDSSNLNSTLRQIDEALHRLMIGLSNKQLTSCINIMVVSDHGMAQRSCSRVLPLDSFINLTTVSYVTGAASRIRPKGVQSAQVIDEFVNKLRCKTDKLLVAKKEELPKRFHYSDHYRIEPIILGPYPGWEVKSTTKAKNNRIVCEGGAHGYDNMAKDMRALFIAMGPSFKKNITVEPFMNIELYNLMAGLIKVTPLPNNGTAGSLNHLLRNPSNITKRTDAIIPQTCSGGNVASYNQIATSCNCTVPSIATTPANAVSIHLPWSSPSSDICLLPNQDFVTGYRSFTKMVAWVSYTVSKNMTKSTKSVTCFGADSRIPSDATAQCAQPNSGLTQEPLFPPSFSNNNASSLISNSVPMYNDFYTNTLTPFNAMVANWTTQYGPLNVIIGPAFDIHGNGIFPGANAIRESVRSGHPKPTHIFVIVTRCLTPNTELQSCNPDRLDVLSLLIPHRLRRENCLPLRDYLTYHSASVKDVEILTGQRFYPSLEYSKAVRLQTKLPEEIWL